MQSSRPIAHRGGISRPLAPSPSTGTLLNLSLDSCPGINQRRNLVRNLRPDVPRLPGPIRRTFQRSVGRRFMTSGKWPACPFGLELTDISEFPGTVTLRSSGNMPSHDDHRPGTPAMPLVPIAPIQRQPLEALQQCPLQHARLRITRRKLTPP